MSYDLWVNSPEESIVSKDSLKARMLIEGWEIRFLPGDAFLGDRALVLLPASGPLDPDLTVYGWRAEQAKSALLDQLFSQGEAKQLEKLFMDEDAFCGCSLSASRSSEKGVKTAYYFRLGGSSVVTSWDMTHALWEAIGELSNGELVNPQEGLEDVIDSRSNRRKIVWGLIAVLFAVTCFSKDLERQIFAAPSPDKQLEATASISSGWGPFFYGATYRINVTDHQANERLTVVTEQQIVGWHSYSLTGINWRGSGHTLQCDWWVHEHQSKMPDVFKITRTP